MITWITNVNEFRPLNNTQKVNEIVKFYNSTISKVFFENDIVVPYNVYHFKQGNQWGSPDVFKIAFTFLNVDDPYLNKYLHRIRKLKNKLKNYIEIELKEVFFTGRGAMCALMYDYSNYSYVCIFDGKDGELNAENRVLGFEIPKELSQ